MRFKSVLRVIVVIGLYISYDISSIKCFVELSNQISELSTSDTNKTTALRSTDVAADSQATNTAKEESNGMNSADTTADTGAGNSNNVINISNLSISSSGSTKDEVNENNKTTKNMNTRQVQKERKMLEKRKREEAERKRLAQIDLEADLTRDHGLLSYDPRAV